MFAKNSQPGFKTLFWMGVAIVLMILDHQGKSVLYVRTVISIPLSLIEHVVGLPVRMIDTVGETVRTHQTLVKENQALKSEQLLLKMKVQRLLAIESENNQLKNLLHFATQVQGKVLIAQLLAVDSDPFVHQLLLDKGALSGVYVGQPVLDANGVMGKIIQVGPITSRVLLINDTSSGVPVQVIRNSVRAIVMGDSYSGKLHVVNVPQTVDIKVGDMLVTSGLGGEYPAGYPIGQVSVVKNSPGMQFATIEVRPSAHLDRGRQVLLIWPNPKAPQPIAKTEGGVK